MGRCGRIACLIIGLLGHHSASAVPTEVIVRVLAKDAMFVGDMAGGVRVSLRDAETGELLAEGIAKGGPGSQKRVIKTARERGVPLSTEDSAKLSVTLDIDEPRKILVTAFGPLSYPSSANSVSATQWLVPGKHITAGDGWVLELPGFFVEIDTPVKNDRVSGGSVDFNVHITMMCGCPITASGPWDAADYEVAVRLKKGDSLVGETPLVYAGRSSQFAGQVSHDGPGAYEAVVYAYDPSNGNTGVDTVRFLVTE